jgi:hypothetical protein
MSRANASQRWASPKAFFALCLLLIANLLAGGSPVEAAGAVASDTATPRRIAVVVGANAAPPGRRALRFAHDDARQIAEVLRRVGRFHADDVHLLLDPTPKELATRLDAVGQTVRTTARNAIFVFYYSGHSDGQDLFPRGDSLSVSELRTRIDSIGARLRLGILDTCRGGSWTQTKGLTVGPPNADIEAVDLMALASEGTALISSSSGLENAHEGRAVKGSFFTHHLTGALLGAADRNADGSVTLQEAFDYAKALTIRDSARMAKTTQHPSFDMQIRGRSDVVLARIPSDTSTLVLTSQTGPLEVIHLASGITVLEMSAGARKVNLALAPGRYLVRKHNEGQIATKEVDVAAGRTAFLAEQDLEVVANPRLAVLSKGQGEEGESGASTPRPLVSLRTTLPRKTWDLRYAIGSSTGPHETWRDTFFIKGTTDDPSKPLSRQLTSSFSLTYGITDRLTWAAPLPAFAYRFGDPSGIEVVPHGGLLALIYGTRTGWMGTLGAGVDFRFHPAAGQSMSVITSATSDFSSSGAINYQPTGAPSVWRLQAGLAYALTLRNAVTFGFSAHAATPLRLGRAAAPGDPQMESTILLGSLPSVGFRPLPLISVHLSDALSIDGYASWAIRPKSGSVVDRYLLGFTWNF